MLLAKGSVRSWRISNCNLREQGHSYGFGFGAERGGLALWSSSAPGPTTHPLSESLHTCTRMSYSTSGSSSTDALSVFG